METMKKYAVTVNGQGMEIARQTVEILFRFRLQSVMSRAKRRYFHIRRKIRRWFFLLPETGLSLTK